jgi:hypothetical protein
MKYHPANRFAATNRADIYATSENRRSSTQSVNDAKSEEGLQKIARVCLYAWLLLCPAAIAAILVISYRENSVSIVFMFMLFLFAGLCLSALFAPRHCWSKTFRLFLSVYAFNVIVVIAFFLIFQAQFGNSYLWGGSDDVTYDEYGLHAAKTLRSSGKVEIPYWRYEKYRGYITTVAIVHIVSSLVGPESTLNPRLLNSFALGLMSVFIFLLGLNLDLPWSTSILGAVAAGLFPVQAFWGAVIIRDILVVLLTVGGVYFFSLLNFRTLFKNLLWILLLAVTIGALWALREKNAILLVLVLLSAAGLRFFLAGGVGRKVLSFSLFSALLIFFAVYIQYYLAEMSQIADVHSEYRMGLSSGLSSLVFKYPLIPIGMILRPLYALVTPLPVFSINPINVFTNLGSIEKLLCLPFALVGLRYIAFDRNRCLLAVVTLACFIAISWTTFQPRHLLIPMPFTFLVAAHGFELFHHRLKLLLGSAFFYALLFGIYFAVK